MVRVCCICKLEYGIVEDVSFHNIPKNEVVKAEWISVIGHEVKSYSAVCSRHFLEKDFHYKVIGDHVRRFLLPTAIPSPLCIYSSLTLEEESMDNFESDSDNSTYFGEVSKSNNDNNFNGIEIEKEYSDYSTNKNLNIEILPNLLLNQETFENMEDCKLSNSSIIICNEECIVKNLKDNIIAETHKPSSSIDKSEVISESTKRTYTPRYIGDLKREDFTSDLTYEIVENFLNQTKKKRKVLNQKIKRLNDKIQSLKSLLDYLKANSYFSSEELAALDNYINKVNNNANTKNT